jgi:hypothetical protein
MNHRIARLAFGLGVGLLVAFMAFKWITNPEPRAERQLEETVVAMSRQHIEATLANAGVELVDPLSPNRKVGKTYVYRAGDGWEVSGYYRRDENDRWHPYLMTLDASHAMTHLKVQDSTLRKIAEQNELLEILP